MSSRKKTSRSVRMKRPLQGDGQLRLTLGRLRPIVTPTWEHPKLYGPSGGSRPCIALSVGQLIAYGTASCIVQHTVYAAYARGYWADDLVVWLRKPKYGGDHVHHEALWRYKMDPLHPTYTVIPPFMLLVDIYKSDAEERGKYYSKHSK